MSAPEEKSRLSVTQKLRMDDRFSWSFTGVVLALLFGAVAVYSVVHERRPSLVCEIDNQSDVLDLHRPLQDLKLAFRGQDIQQQNLNLRILTIRLVNRGGLDILQNQYDQEADWGLRVVPPQLELERAFCR